MAAVLVGLVIAQVNTAMAEGVTWILNESANLQSHAVAVAHAVGLPFDLKRLQLTGPLRYLPSGLQVNFSPARLLVSVAPKESFDSSWPRLVIAIGRRSVPLALALKSLSQPPCFALHIRYRKWSERQFNMVVTSTNGLSSAKLKATFDAVYNVAPKSSLRNMHWETDVSINDVDVVAKVIKGALGLRHSPRT